MAQSYNPNNNTSANFNQGPQNRSTFSKILRDLSNFGLNYDDMLLRNRQLVGLNEDPNAIKGNMYDFFSARAVASLLNKKMIPFLKVGYADKIKILREYSIKDEMRDFLTSVCDEAIIYNEEKKFCTLVNISDEYPQEIKDKLNETFERIYNRLGFSDGLSAWQIFRRLLVDGVIALEIVYDDKGENIIGFESIEPYSVLPGIDNQGKAIWVQHHDSPQLRKIVLDTNIIFISYSSHNEFDEMSYIEGLIKPYNQLKLMEQTRIMFNIVNASVYQKFTIPINGLSRQRAEEEISRLIADYSEEVEWDDSLGTVSINGQKHLPLNKQLWFPSGESGTPQMELIKQEGHNLNENEMLTWFYNALKRASRIPFTRFDKDNGGGNIYSDASEMTRDEVKFGNFIKRLRMLYKEIIVKPLRIQMLIDFPELRKDESFLNSLDIEFNSNDLFEEWKKLNNMQKRVDIVTSLSSLQDIEGKPYFHLEYLMDKIYKLSEEDRQENEAYKLKYEGGQATGSSSGGSEFPESSPMTESTPQEPESAASPETPAGTEPTPPAGGTEPTPGGDFEF